MTRGTATVRVQMLDNSIHTYDVKVKSYANVLYQSVMKDLNLLEADYFGIEYADKCGIKFFVDPLKKIKSQFTNINNVVLKFVVKFFPPDPGQLQEEYTRYLFALQLKQDIADGSLVCSDNTLAVLASYIAQSEFGDWNTADCSDLTYLKDLKILPAQYEDTDVLTKISDRHKTTMSQTPADADFHLLDVARKLELYGMRMHPARDQENTNINLAVAHMGVLVFRDNSKINTFNWARIRKLSFKKKRFLIKLKAESSNDGKPDEVGDILVFVMKSRDSCKAFWRLCLEHHAFFRLDIRPEPKRQPVLLKRGSTFRYSGKTQKQLHDLVRNSNFRRTTFTRASKRQATTPSNDAEWVRPPIVVENGPNVHTSLQSGDAAAAQTTAEVEINGYLQNKSDCETAQANVMSDRSPAASESWQVKSENLHSSVVTNDEYNDQKKKTGNRIALPVHEKSFNTTNSSPHGPQFEIPDILNDVECVRDWHNVSGDSHRNDNGEASMTFSAPYLSKNILSIESVSSSSRSSSVSRSSSSLSGVERMKNDAPTPIHLIRDEELATPPPLPPKLNFPSAETKTPETDLDAVDGPAVGDTVSNVPLMQFPLVTSVDSKSSPLSNVKLRQHSVALSASEVSIPSIAGGEPRTPSQYEILEQKLIKAGFYSVPKKPPAPPDEMMSGEESDFGGALDGSDLVSPHHGSEYESSTNSRNGLCDVAVYSEDEDSMETSLKTSDLLTPITMKFDDHYIGPDYNSTDALSSFAIEMKGSRDHICHTPFSLHMNKKSCDDSHKRHLAGNMNTHNPPRRIVHQESDDVVQL